MSGLFYQRGFMNDMESRGLDQQSMVLQDNTYQSCGPTVTRLPAGAYSLTSDCYGRLQSRAAEVAFTSTA
jgi:hypothetical protein